jgi:hypothetical protein
VCGAPTDCLSGLCTAKACGGGLAAYWAFDEGQGVTALDTSGNQNHGTLVQSPIWTVGRAGGALDFNGFDSVVMVPNSASLNPGGAMSISLWLTNPVPASWSGPLMKTTSTNWNDGYGIFVDALKPGKLCGFVSKQGNEACGDLASGLTFHHIAFVYDLAAVTFYVDGVVGGSLPVNGNPSASGAGLLLGKTVGYAGWKGKIDEIRLFNRPLSPAEIQMLYTTP